MKIINNPTVYLLSKQVIVPEGLDSFLADHGLAWASDGTSAAEIVSETAGRVCYMSFAKPRPGGNSAYLDHIKEVGHGSVLEHAVWTFLIVGVSRSLTHELVRHRAGFAFSQLSQRYVDESVAEYVCPDIIANDPELHEIWLDAVQHSHEAYQKLAEKLNEKMRSRTASCNSDDCQGGYMASERQKGHYVVCPVCKGDSEHAYYPAPFRKYLNLGKYDSADVTTVRKAARQAARSVLPNATETKITVTANARAIRHFLEQRGSVHAEPEIRKLANAILDVVQADSPNLFGDYTKVALPDGTFEVRTNYRKV